MGDGVGYFAEILERRTSEQLECLQGEVVGRSRVTLLQQRLGFAEPRVARAGRVRRCVEMGAGCAKTRERRREVGRSKMRLSAHHRRAPRAHGHPKRLALCVGPLGLGARARVLSRCEQELARANAGLERAAGPRGP